MYTVSQLWSDIVSEEDHYFVAKVLIDTINEYGEIEATEFGDDYIIEMSVSLGMFGSDQPGAGGCVSGELNLRMHLPGRTIPRMAKIQPYVMATDGVQESEWIPQGKFFVDTRETTHDDDGMPIISFHAYDAMMKAEADYPDTGHDWDHFTDIQTVMEIADAMGVGVDERTEELMVSGYEIGVPVGFTMRDVLSNIAGMYAGNWVMNYDGELLLIGIGEIPIDTSYLVNNVGKAIVFGDFDNPDGGVRILV